MIFNNIKYGLLEEDFNALAEYNGNKMKGILYDEDTIKRMESFKQYLIIIPKEYIHLTINQI